MGTHPSENRLQANLREKGSRKNSVSSDTPPIIHPSPPPVNTRHLYNICTMSGQRRRRWADVVQMFCVCWDLHPKIGLYQNTLLYCSVYRFLLHMCLWFHLNLRCSSNIIRLCYIGNCCKIVMWWSCYRACWKLVQNSHVVMWLIWARWELVRTGCLMDKDIWIYKTYNVHDVLIFVSVDCVQVLIWFCQVEL